MLYKRASDLGSSAAFHLIVLSVIWPTADLQLNTLLVLPSVLDGLECVVIQ